MMRIILSIILISYLFSVPNYNLELIQNIEVNSFNSNSDFGVSDVWGYTDETGIEYAVVGYRNGTFIYDVSTNPESQVLISDIPGPSGSDYYYHRDYKTYEDYLYIVNEMTGSDIGMQVIDLSPLPEELPIQLDTYTGFNQSHNLWIDVDEGYAFIENQYPDNIHIVDLYYGDNPQYAGTFGIQGNNCHDIFTHNGIAYVSEGYSNQYGIYDISNINNITLLATIPVVGYAHNAWLSDSGTHLITTEETSGITVKIWDITDLNNINLVSEYLGENELAHNVHVENNQLFISHYTTGIKVVDIYNPERPVEVAAYDTYIDNDSDGFYACWGAYPFTQNNYIYASDMQYGLFILEYDSIYAGWSSGYIYDEYGQILANLELKSLLNNHIFHSDQFGYYEFGFPEGNQEFEFSIGNTLDTLSIAFYPHQEVEQNIYINSDNMNPGDINQDGIIDILDIVNIINIILGNYIPSGVEFQLADFNNDNDINVLDIICIVNIILE